MPSSESEYHSDQVHVSRGSRKISRGSTQFHLEFFMEKGPYGSNPSMQTLPNDIVKGYTKMQEPAVIQHYITVGEPDCVGRSFKVI